MTLIRDPDKATREGVFAGELPTTFNDPKKAARVVAMLVGADGAPASLGDAGGASEATLLQVLSALQVLSGNTDGLEAFAQQSRDLLAQLGTYNDGVESLLGTLNANTDGIEGLLSALGLKDDNVLSKLTEILAKDEQIRALLAGTLAISAAALPLPAGASTSDLQTAGNTVLSNILTAVGLLGTEATQVAIRNALQGTLLVRANPDAPAIITLNMAAGSSASDPILLNTQAISAIDLGPNWTAADLTVDHSTDGGATWYPMYDTFGNPLQYRIAANRSVAIPLADLMRRGRIRFRSGVPGAYVNQVVVTALTLTVVTL